MSYVPSTGPRDAKVIILGEAPGANEAKIGKPFVGQSGKLLTQLLARAGILREQCYITNVIKERPLDNKIEAFIDLFTKKPKVSPKGQEYLRLLENELRKLSPNVIVPTGNVGLWALTGKRGITKWRGSILQDIAGRKIIPTIHPASALRNYIHRYYILSDLQKVAREQHSSTVPKDPRTYYIRPSFDQVIDYLDECKKSPRVAFDIECTKEVTCISFSHSPGHALSIPFSEHRDPYFLLPQEAYIWKEIAEVLENPNIEKVAHNATFDVTFLFRKYGIRTVNIQDTMIAQGILYPDFQKDLGFCTTWYTDLPYYKDEGKASMRSQDNESFWLYNAKDSVVLMEMLPQMLDLLKTQGNYETYRSQCELIEPLVYMTELGLRIDIDSLQTRSNETADFIKEKEILLNSIVGYEINGNSIKQLKQYFYKERGHKPYLNRTTGKPTCDEKALKRLARKGEQAASVILDIREMVKLKGSYLDVKLGEDKRLRGSFNPIGTSTLRLSSSKDIYQVGTNLQTLPPRMKANIIPDEGYLLVEVDAAQAENRVVAYIAPDERMIEAFETGVDIHSQTAGLLFEMDPEEVKTLYKEFESTRTPTPRLCAPIGQGNKPWRYWGKEADHALNFGFGPNSAALRWEIPQADAKFLYDRYHRAYPGVKMMHRWIKQALSDTRVISNLFGFNRQFLGRWEDSLKAAYAFVAQSTIAELINRRGLKPLYYSQALFPQIQILGQVHDSIIFQVPLEIGWEEISRYLTLLTTSLEEPLTFRGREFSIPTEVKLFPHNLNEGIQTPKLDASSLEAAYTQALVHTV